MSRQSVGFLDAAHAWLQSRRAAGLAPRTLEFGQLVVEAIGRHLENRPLSGIQPFELDQLRSALAAEGYSPSWINTCREKFRLLWRWARQMGLVRHDPLEGWDKVKGTARRKRLALTPAETARFISALLPRYRGWATFAALTGLRTGTCRALQWEDVVDRPEGGSYLCIPGWKMKMRKAFTTPLHPEARAALGAHGDPKALVFDLPTISGIWREFKRAARVAGIDPAMSAHQLRRCYVRWLREGGACTREIADCGGWASLNVVQRYYDAETKEARRSELLGGLGARWQKAQEGLQPPPGAGANGSGVSG